MKSVYFYIEVAGTKKHDGALTKPHELKQLRDSVDINVSLKS